jgi:CAAX prenyl protease-like protein
LIENQKSGPGGGNNEENAGNENYRTIATRFRAMRTVSGQLGLEQLHQLFWRWFGRLDFFHGFPAPMFGASPTEKAYFAPFLAFFAVMALGMIVGTFGDGQAFWVLGETRYWVCPLQTVLCGGILIRYWRFYGMKAPAKPWLTIGIGVLALILWIAPQEWLHLPQRWEGFNPGFFGDRGWPYWLNLGTRFLRLVVVVPLLEEIFWRGFLLRYLIDEDFVRVPMGAFSWLSFTVVAVGFCFEHSMPDWPAAFLTGALYNLVAYRTRSLSSCVLAHAVTNALLGAYVLRTGQWGFW